MKTISRLRTFSILMKFKSKIDCGTQIQSIFDLCSTNEN
ncbi:hypothetical protein PMARG_ME00289 [Candidatus Mikella endobia]|uniref:Uncharacterized protein n=1 Tax=Candidatus Mikella endobia TaxID=1778264 RepID=A0A143WT34_9ENTR|nr:hypothetical protein PMARG_ME00289 [Candidatus Mikella endobia]